MRSGCLKVLAGLGLCLSFGNGEAFVAGAKATGMGQTGIAYGQDAYAGVYNPAGSIDAGDRFDITYECMQNHKYMTIRKNSNAKNNGTYNAQRVQQFNNGDFAINKCLCTDIWGGSLNWSVGFAAYNSDFIKTKYRSKIPLFGTKHLAGEYCRETFSPFLAIAINRCHSIGISFDAHLQRFNAAGLQSFDNATNSVAPGRVTNKGFSHSGGVSGTFGWRWRIYDCLSFGLTYRTEAKMSRFRKYKGLISQHGRMDIPEKYGFGLAYRFMPCATVTADVEWINWRNITSLHKHYFNADGTQNKFGDKAAAAVTSGPNPTPATTNGPGYGWRSQPTYRFGVEYAVSNCLSLRGGYIYGRQLITPSETQPNAWLMNVIQSYATVGATWSFYKCNEITFFYAHGFEKRVRGSHSISAAQGGGNVDLKENKDVGGISWGCYF